MIESGRLVFYYGMPAGRALMPKAALRPQAILQGTEAAILQEFKPTEQTGGEEGPGGPESIDQALEQIDRLLRQMLLLAGLSASDAAVNRAQLQGALDRLRDKIDRIADGIQ
jgi:hypothetical protein